MSIFIVPIIRAIILKTMSEIIFLLYIIVFQEFSYEPQTI